MEDTIDLLQIKINKAKAELSQETRNAIDAVPWQAEILKMRETKGYSFEQLGDLELETELLLCGLVSPEDYPIEIQNRMQISKNEADDLVKEMNNFVFSKIKEELMKNIERVPPPLDKGRAEEGSLVSPLLDKGRTEEGSLVPPPPSGEVGRRFLNSPHLFKPEGLSDIRPESSVPREPERPDPLLNKERENTPPNTEEEKKNTQVLKSAGIEIVPDMPAETSTRLMQTEKLEINSPQTILAQKLSGSVKNEVV